MKRLLTAICLAALLSVRLAATTYYVSSTAGSDSNNGTSQTTPWKTLAKVNSTALAPGDSVLLARGDTWRESLVPPSSGTSASAIFFDAYGSGAAPVITGYQDLSSASWTLLSGNVWQTSITATGINNALFGTIWGQKQASQSAVQHDRDFYFSANKLYIYSAGNPGTYYSSIAAITTAAGQLIYINGNSWLRFQHISLSWFDGFGVNIAGASDHLVFANMESNGMVPAGTLPHGFYINANSPGDISFYNVEAHLNYDGFKFDGSATAITLVNCKAYVNRDGGLVDNTGHATYSYSHFYANNIAIFNSQDTQGGAHDGGNNLPVDTPPAVVNFTTYPARITFTVDDVGFAPGTEMYIDSLIPAFNGRGLKLSAAVVTGYSSGLIGHIQSWLAGGQDVNSHSWSHQYYTNTNAFTIRYTGSGSAATLTISGNHLTTTVTGGPGGENLNYDLTDPAYDTATELVAVINTHGGYTAALDSNCRTAAHTIGLADVSAHDIKATYTAQFQKDRLEPDELTSSKIWLQTNIPGLSNVKAFVYPDGIQDSQTQVWATAAGYEGARGALSIGLGSNSVYSKGVNLQDITSLGISGLHGMTAGQIDAEIAALVFKASVWGVPYGLFVHVDDLTPAEVAMTLDSLIAHGAVVMTNTQLIDWIATTSNIPATTSYVSTAPGPTPDFHPTPASPILNAGANLGPLYQLDLAGLLRPQANAWDIGAYSHLSAVYGAGSGSGSFTWGVPKVITGPPLTYAARTDTCELSTDTYGGQNCGTLGLALSFREQDGGTVPNVGGYSGETLDQAHCPVVNGASAWNGSACTRAVNVQYVDPDFHSITIRASDGTDYPGTGGGVSPAGPSGGNNTWWNTDSTMFIMSNTNGVVGLRYFDPATRTLTGSQLTSKNGDSTCTHDCTLFAKGGDIQFSGKDSTVAFERDGTAIYKLVINKATDTIATRTLIVDFSNAGTNCLPAGYNANAPVGTWSGNFGVDINDSTFVSSFAGGPDWQAGQTVPLNYVVFPVTNNGSHHGFAATAVSGPTGSIQPVWSSACTTTCTDGGVTWTDFGNDFAQEHGFDAVAYTVGKGCRHYNTRRGVITGDWGCSYAVGGISCSGSASATQIVTDNPIDCPTRASGMCALNDYMSLHGVSGLPNERFANLSANWHYDTPWSSAQNSAKGITYYWDVGTNVIRGCNGSGCSGHEANGYKYLYRGGTYKRIDPGDPIENGAVNPGTGVTLTTLSCDDHGSYVNSGTQDLTPLFKFTTDSPTARSGQVSAFCDEIVGASTDGNYTTYRFGSNYNTGSGSYFTPQQAIGMISQDGKWVLRWSDMMGTLGSAFSATAAACNNLRADAKRNDVNGQTVALGFRVQDPPVQGDIYEITTAGTLDAKASNVNFNRTLNATTPDGTAVWTDIGVNNCRGDAFITDLMSAH